MGFTALGNKITETTTGNPSIDIVWEEISSVLAGAAEESLGLKERESSNPWFDQECRVATDFKNEAYTTMIQRHTRRSAEAVSYTHLDVYKRQIQVTQNCMTTVQKLIQAISITKMFK